MTKSRTCDVLIIGGGSAGLRAAIEAHDGGAQVLIISKGEKGHPHTEVARGGINAALGTMDPEDSWMILDRLPTMYEQFKNLDGIDISKQKMEVAPTAHYSMGGVVVDGECRTTVKRLFAAGETMSQIHGANRLGGNSLLDTVVFGKMAGSQAARLAKEIVEIEKTRSPSRSVNNN